MISMVFLHSTADILGCMTESRPNGIPKHVYWLHLWLFILMYVVLFIFVYLLP
ncbi:uncharacterized protein C4orf3 homolog [Ochotona curzoniae]|uniref:uncharacterized protein C4orf3 homolog n=1 Tax=Ochotona curzoniae TaxID=130825 RepID=UPI001B351854|nr:uncharacterized protein C4orf3 homolog [Ochotona curzoniae]